jgi:class 3 adenylate cyclase
MWYTCRICLFGLLETERRNQITVIGNTVNLASRLEKIATNDEIIVFEKVKNITQSQFEFESMKIEEKIKLFENVKSVFKLVRKVENNPAL